MTPYHLITGITLIIAGLLVCWFADWADGGVSKEGNTAAELLVGY